MHPDSNEFYNDLYLLFDEINRNNKNSILAANQIIGVINKKIKELHRWLKKHTFTSIDDEIYFFKYVKPRLISQLIYYTKIVDIESNSPTAKKIKIKYLEKELEQIFQYSKKNKIFNQYFRSGAKHYDHQYFTRTRGKQLTFYECHIINYDIRVSTPHDYCVAQIIANDLLVNYLEQKLANISSNSLTDKLPTLNWTGNKIDLIELIYALQKQKVINHGNIDIKDLAISIGQIFNMELEDSVYRSYIDIKNRKEDKTKFLNRLSKVLIDDIEDEK